MDTNALVAQLSPLLLQALGVIGTALLAWLTVSVRKWAGVADEAASRDALHSALTTGATAAATLANASVGSVAKDALAYARQSVPDAFAALKPTSEVQAILARAKAAQAMAAQQTIVSKS
jgi:hypothetical protein